VGGRLTRTCATAVLSLALIPLTVTGGGRERGRVSYNSEPVYWSFALWLLVLAMFLIVAPDNFFGPSWHYFHQLPQNGFWMGLCCFWLSGFQIITLKRGWGKGMLAVLLFCGGFVFWTSGLLIGAAGILGHQGLMEAPFMMYAGAHNFAHSAVLMYESRKGCQPKGRHAK
jgi:hypothetical protein